MRPRNVLLAACPWLSREEASEALRNAGGDVENAKRTASTAQRQQQQHQQIEPSDAGSKTDKVGRKREGNDEQIGSAPTASVAPAATVNGEKNDNNKKSAPPPAPVRAPPRHAVSINNLSDRQYCCVWSVEVYPDGYRPDVARTLLATVARHVNPILRDRGWRVKRLIESASTQWIGLCTANGRNDADAASTNIQLNLRVRPDRRCKQFRSLPQILAVMLHEITHTSIGLEDIHPPAFYELLDRIKLEYRQKIAAGEVDRETDDYGCNDQFINSSGELSSVASSASDILGTNGFNDLSLLGKAGSEGDCGASKGRRRRGGWRRRNRSKYTAGYTSNVPKKQKKVPLLKGTKMIDKRTKVGKAAMLERDNLPARELAARAALARFDHKPDASVAASSSASSYAVNLYAPSDSEDEDSEEGYISDYTEGDDKCIGIDEPIKEHNFGCGCRTCDWSKLFDLD